MTSAKSKKKKMISTTSTKDSKKDTKLYCICKTPYDETKYDNVITQEGSFGNRDRHMFSSKHQC